MFENFFNSLLFSVLFILTETECNTSLFLADIHVTIQDYILI